MSFIKLYSSYNILGFKMLQNDDTIAIVDLLLIDGDIKDFLTKGLRKT